MHKEAESNFLKPYRDLKLNFLEIVLKIFDCEYLVGIKTIA